MVDVMLVLLIIFMVTAPLLTVGVPVDLPETEAKALTADKRADDRSRSTPTGKIFLQETEIDARRAGAAAAGDRQAPATTSASSCAATSAANYGAVMEVMGLITGAGFTQRRRWSPTRPPGRLIPDAQAGRHRLRSSPMSCIAGLGPALRLSASPTPFDASSVEALPVELVPISELTEPRRRARRPPRSRTSRRRTSRAEKDPPKPAADAATAEADAAPSTPPPPKAEPTPPAPKPEPTPPAAEGRRRRRRRARAAAGKPRRAGAGADAEPAGAPSRRRSREGRRSRAAAAGAEAARKPTPPRSRRRRSPTRRPPRSRRRRRRARPIRIRSGQDHGAARPPKPTGSIAGEPGRRDGIGAASRPRRRRAIACRQSEIDALRAQVSALLEPAGRRDRSARDVIVTIRVKLDAGRPRARPPQCRAASRHEHFARPRPKRAVRAVHCAARRSSCRPRNTTQWSEVADRLRPAGT